MACDRPMRLDRTEPNRPVRTRLRNHQKPDSPKTEKFQKHSKSCAHVCPKRAHVVRKTGKFQKHPKCAHVCPTRVHAHTSMPFIQRNLAQVTLNILCSTQYIMNKFWLSIYTVGSNLILSMWDISQFCFFHIT